MPPQIIINEMHPNPESGNEWIELWIDGDATTIDNFSLNNYTIFDSLRQIYKFTNEKFVNQLLVVEVSGLNNDQDSVVLKNEAGNTLDSFSYTTTQKGLSFARNLETGNFELENPSKNQINPVKTPAPTTSITPAIEELSSSPTPEFIREITTPSITNTPTITQGLKPTLSPIIKSAQKYHEYDLSKVQLITRENIFKERLTRLVFLGKNEGQAEIINAIIGSLLIILSSAFLIYVRTKNKKS